MKKDRHFTKQKTQKANKHEKPLNIISNFKLEFE